MTEFHIPKDQDPGPEVSEKIPSASVEAFGVLLLKIPKVNNKKRNIMKLYLFAMNSTDTAQKSKWWLITIFIFEYLFLVKIV